MSAAPVLLDIAGSIATITINRPDKLNALNSDTLSALDGALDSLAAERAVRAAILTGAGEKAFVAGADISQFSSLDRAGGEAFAVRGQAIFRKLEKLSIPVIAAINGFALGGGCELAMACHIRIASERARFGQPEINLGIIPGYGGTQRLPRLVGKSTALHMMLTGDMIDAARALAIGLVSEVVPAADLMTRARELASTIAGKAPIAAALILRATYDGGETDLDAGLAIEAAGFGESCGTEDMREGAAAFLEKRKPVFSGK